MYNRLQQLITQLQLETIDDRIYRGTSVDVGTGMVFGGQVLGQAISAAQATVNNRSLHSVHAYFLRPGNHDLPIIYTVDITRDGRSYSSRTVTATQTGKTIFTMMCSFHSGEDSELHYLQATEEQTPDDDTLIEMDLEEEWDIEHSSRRVVLNPQPFLIRSPIESIDANAPNECLWLRTKGDLPDDPKLHRSLLAYASDFRLLASTLRPVGYRYQLDTIMLATICHGIWFHQDFRMDDWLLTICEPLAVANGRGIAKGSIYNRHGILVATTMQEGVVRKLKTD